MSTVLFPSPRTTLPAPPFPRGLFGGAQPVIADETDASADRVLVSIDAAPDAAFRRYGLEQLLRIVGVRCVYEHCARPTIYCGRDPAIGRAAAVWIPTGTNEAYRSEPWTWAVVEGVLAPTRGAAPHGVREKNRLTFDAAWSAAYWLTLAGERFSAERDVHGRTLGATSPLTQDSALRPPVDAYAELLAAALPAATVGQRRVPRWPHGKRYAVSLSHDVDSPERVNPAPRLLRGMLTGNAAARRTSFWELCDDVRARGLREACLRGPSARREWDFARLCALEQEHGLRSAFYFAVVNREDGHHRDVPYDASRRRYRRMYRQLAAGGWEVGLHAGYLTRLGRPGVFVQAGRLAQLAGQPVAGVRHHYLHLDPDDPLRTLAAHDDAGLTYDSSIGFNDCAGHRAGTALPFQPYDAARGEARPLVELPLTIADMHLPQDDVGEATRRVIEHLQRARGLGGLAMLDWHVGHWHATPAWRESYRAACRFLAEDSDAWVATPAQVAAWWRKRSEWCA